MFNNYNKPGLGINKDEPEKRGVFLFLELFFRKFWKYVGLNILYFLCLIPFLFGTITLSFVVVPPVIPIVLAPLLLGVCILTPGFVYVLRNYTWEHHAWVLSDYFRHIKNNIGQALILFVLDLVGFFVIYNNIMFYLAFDFANGMNIILAVINASLALVYLMMNMYIYLLMVTFKMRLIDILKNALILTFAKFPINFIVMLIAIWLGVIILYIPYGMGLPVVALIGFSAIGLTLTFYPARVVRKHMIKEDKSPDDDEKIVFEDKIKKDS